jgi:hypothetical protein
MQFELFKREPDMLKSVSADNAAAILFILSTVFLVGLGIILALTGHLAGMYAGPEDTTVNLTVRRWTFRVASLAMILALFGFALLTARLQAAGERTLSTVALVGFTVAAIGWLIEITVTLSVGELAIKAAAQTGIIPEYWEPIHQWTNVSWQQVYVAVGTVSVALYGCSLLVTGLTTAWVGWAAVVWSVPWFLAAVLGPFTIPGVLLLIPFVIGIALLQA